MKRVIIGAFVAAIVASAFATGLRKGDSVTAFHPYHVSGPLANSDRCFPCTFQNRPQVQVWVNGDDAKNVATIAQNLQAQMEKNKGREFKAMVVFLASPDKVEATKATVRELAKKVGGDVALSVLSTKDDAVKAYRVDLANKNTVFVYRNWKVTETMTNFKADAAGVGSLNSAIGNIL